MDYDADAIQVPDPALVATYRRDGLLLAPMKNHLMLPGITYDIVLELAALHGLPHEVRDITEAKRAAAETADLQNQLQQA